MRAPGVCGASDHCGMMMMVMTLTPAVEDLEISLELLARDHVNTTAELKTKMRA